MARIRKKPSIGGLLIFIIFIGILVTIFNGGKSQPEATKGSSSQTDPKTIYDFSYRKAIEQSGATSWIFEGKNKPPLKLSDKTQFIEDINLALDAIGLPMGVSLCTRARIFNWITNSSRRIPMGGLSTWKVTYP